MDFDDESIQEFILEATELLEEAEQGLLNIEDGGDYHDNFKSVFRAFHSVKGGAGMLGLDETNKVVHFLEDILTEADKEKKMNPQLIDFFLQGIDSTKKALIGEDHRFEFKSPFEEKVSTAETKTNTQRKIQKKKNTTSITSARIFHVDDEVQICEVIKLMLETDGHQVTSFLSGEEMLKCLKPGQVDIVISDFRMPNMTGNEVLRAVKKIDPDIPTILLSGFLEQKDCIEAVNNGAFALLEKPINFGLMHSTLTNAFNSVKYSRLIGRSIKLLMYQFSDLNEFLTSAGKENIIETIRTEMENLIEERNSIREIQKNVKTES
jgi:FixJ family two-component response regulator/HPt (histidine-containing phosphotransfer) domain-containing protein